MHIQIIFVTQYNTNKQVRDYYKSSTSINISHVYLLLFFTLSFREYMICGYIFMNHMISHKYNILWMNKCEIWKVFLCSGLFLYVLYYSFHDSSTFLYFHGHLDIRLVLTYCLFHLETDVKGNKLNKQAFRSVIKFGKCLEFRIIWTRIHEHEKS